MSLVHIGYRFRDADGDVSTLSIKIKRSVYTLAEIEEFAEEFGDLLDACSDAVIDSVTLSVGLDVPVAWKDNPVAGCDVERGALLAYAVTDTTYRMSYRVPAWKDALFTANAVKADEAVVIALDAAFRLGLDASGTQIQPCNLYELDLSSYISGQKSFRK